MLSHGNRLYLRRILRSRISKIVLLLIFIINLLDVLRIHANIANGDRILSSPPPVPRERIYIASMHFNNGAILKSHWNNAVLKLAETFGVENVFVSVYESGSWDDSKEVLRELDAELEKRGVPHRIETSDVTHHDELEKGDKGEGWIDTKRGKRELRRIPYLAKLRNKTLKDLFDLHEKGVTFDKVLFLNDVVFTVCFLWALCIWSSTNCMRLTGRGCPDPFRYERWRLRRSLLARFLQTTFILRHFCT